MDSDNVDLEQRLNSFFIQLQNESRVLDRIVYKGKNQHRRCLYFQYIMKVRRDVKLLLLAGLQEIWSFLFQIINAKKPTRTVNLLESLKRRKCNTENYNYQEWLLGVARLLSQMVEPMVKAAIEISSLLARSFFMGFSVTILSILGRLRVLVQQILLDVVSVFNMISSISQKEHSVKLNRQGIQVIREHYPSDDKIVTLECIWGKDKFVLLEKLNKFEIKKRVTGFQSSNIKYQTVEAFLGLGGDGTGNKKMETNKSIEDHSNFKNICIHKASKSAEQPMNISVKRKDSIHIHTYPSFSNLPGGVLDRLQGLYYLIHLVITRLIMDQYPMITQQLYGFGLPCLNTSMRVSAFSPWIAPSNAFGRSSQSCVESNVKEVSSYSSVTKKFSWKIDEFSKLNAQDGSYSDVFSVGDYKWKVRIHPKGEGKVYDHLSLFLKPVELIRSVETEFSIEVTCQTDPNNSVRHGTNRKFLQRRGNRSHGWPKFMPLSEIYDPDKGYIVNDTCVVTIEITCTTRGEELELNADGGTSNGESNLVKVSELKRRKVNDERQ